MQYWMVSNYRYTTTTNMNKRSKSAGVLVECDGKYLLGHATGMGKCYSIPKGKVEPYEEDMAAALRELREETNISLTCKDLESSEPFRYTSRGGKKMVVYHAKLASIPANIFCSTLVDGSDKKEFDTFHWVTKEEALQLLNNHMTAIFVVLC